MAAVTVVKTIGTTGTFSTPQLWEDGAPADLTTAERSACGTFAVATFVQGENLTFVGSGATGKMLDTDSTGVGTGTYMTYGITAGNPATSDVITGGTSTATCILTSGTPDFTGVVWQGQCQNQEFSGAATQLTTSGSTSSSTAYKHFTTISGASFRDHVNVQTNALKYNAANGCGLRSTAAGTIFASEDHVRVTNMQTVTTVASNAGLNNTSNSAVIDNVIIEGTSTSVSSTSGPGVFTGTGTIVKNTVIIQNSSAADHVIGTGTGSPSFYNCTVVAPDDLGTAPTSVLLSGASGTVTVQNCGLFAGDSTKAVKAGSATFNFTTCYSDISGTGGVTQTTYGDAFQNVNDATRDFRLKTGSALIDTGTTDATNAATDIAGTARPSGAAYDVGAWEFVQAVGSVRVGSVP
jgi:hypothetical protein